MPRLSSIKYALPSLAFSLLMAITTLLHHLHAGLVLHPGGAGMHVVWNEIFLIPLTVGTMLVFLKNGSKYALWIYLGIAVLGFFGLGLFEGGWNHTAKLLAYLRIDSLRADIGTILPPDNPHLWFYEGTGVLTFVFAMLASYFTYRFWITTRKPNQGSNS